MRHAVRARRLAAGTLTALTTVVALTGCGATVTTGGGGDTPTGAAPTGADTALHDRLPESVRTAGVLRFAGDSHPPYRTIASDGSITGIDADFQAELGRVLGVETETIVVDGLPAALQGMLSARYDAFNGPVRATAEREQQFDTVTWMTTRTSYVVPVGSALTVDGAEDLCGHSVAIVAGSVVEGQLAALSEFCAAGGQAAVTPVGLADTNDTLLATQSGRADAAGMTQAAAIDITVQREGEFGYVTQTEEQGATTDNLAIYVPKDTGLGPVVLDAYRELFADGTYAEIMARWGLEDTTVPEPILNAGTP